MQSPDYSWKLLEPSARVLFFFLIQALFEGIKDHTVRLFDLAVGSWMGNGNIFDGDATVFVEILEMMSSKHSSEIGDDAVW